MRIKNVEYFDRLKRKEQRAMNNKEVSEVQGKKVKYCLFFHERKFPKKDDEN